MEEGISTKGKSLEDPIVSVTYDGEKWVEVSNLSLELASLDTMLHSVEFQTGFRVKQHELKNLLA